MEELFAMCIKHLQQIWRLQTQSCILKLFQRMIFLKIRLCFQEDCRLLEDTIVNLNAFNDLQIFSFARDILAVAAIFLKHNLDLSCLKTSNLSKNSSQRWTGDFLAQRELTDLHRSFAQKQHITLKSGETLHTD